MSSRPVNESSSPRFADRVAIVTGGVSGIGAAITARFASEGARVVVADIDDTQLATVTEVFGPRVSGMGVDVTEEAEVERLVAETVRRHGTLDVMVNAVGGPRAAPLTELSAKDWDAVVRLNLHTAFFGTRLAARQFIAEGKPGAIVNIASLSSEVPMHLGAGYNASKAGVAMLTRQAALELAEHRIRVNAVSPGLIATPLARTLLDTPGVAEAFLEFIPAGRTGDPFEVAAAVAFMASDDASYVSGQNLFVDGAWSTAGYPDLRALRS